MRKLPKFDKKLPAIQRDSAPASINGTLCPGIGALSDEEKKQIVIDTLANGETVTVACKRAGITFIQEDALKRSDPIYAERRRNARAIGLDLLAESLLTQHEVNDPARARIASENKRWLLARWKPEVYGDRLDLSVTQQPDVRTVLEAARARRMGVTIDAQAEPRDDDRSNDIGSLLE